MDLCVGLYAADFPVLVVLEIHDAVCSINGLHEAELGVENEWRSLSEGHLKERRFMGNCQKGEAFFECMNLY